ncbi:MAG: 3'-5' exonuclease [Oscillospiraceae bacterium]
MNYIIFDMEWNQPVVKELVVKKPIYLIGEIIQIGAVKLIKNNSEFKVVSTFKQTIKPQYYKKMNSAVKRITNLSNKDLQKGNPFKRAIEDFKEFCGINNNESVCFITWGFDDIPMLKDNLALHNCDESWIKNEYNLQVTFNAQVTGETNQYSLEKAMEQLNITSDKIAHDALNDAIFTTKVFNMLNMEIGFAQYEQNLKFMQNTLDAQVTELFGFNGFKDATDSEKIKLFICPDCNKKIKSKEIISCGTDRKITMVDCPNCGDFFVKMKIKMERDMTYSIRRILKKADDEKRDYYNKRLKKHNEFIKKQKSN